jgi:short-subunit dehydrogenase
MNYILSEDGLDVKVINPKTGQTKFITKHIAENAKRMQSLGLQIMEAPLMAEAVFVEQTKDPEQLDLTPVAETVVAKKDSKPKK